VRQVRVHGDSPAGSRGQRFDRSLRFAVAEADGWSPLSAVGSLIAKTHPAFDPRNYGCSKLGELVRRQPFIETKEVPAGDGLSNIHLFVRPKRVSFA